MPTSSSASARARARFGIVRPQTRSIVWLALGALYVIWGSTYLGIRVAIESIPPLTMASVRFLAAGAILWTVSIGRGDAIADRPGLREWRDSAIVGGALLLGGMGLVAIGEQTVPSGIAALFIATLPLWIAVLSRVFLGERITRPVAAGIALGFAGIVILVAPSGSQRLDAFGLAALVISPICWASGTLYSRRASLPSRPLVATAMQMLCGGLILGVAAIITGEPGRLDLARITGASVAALAYLVAAGSLVAFSCYVWLIRNAPVSTVATYAYVNPVIAVVLGSVLLGEQIGPRALLGGGIIIAAVAIIITTRGRREQPPPAEA